MLQAEAIDKSYLTRAGALDVLRGVNLQLLAGQAAVILGPSGSGKSTLLNILGTLEPPTAGRVRLEGCDPFALRERALARFRNRRIGFVFQDHHLLPQCSVLENVLLPTLAGGAQDRADTGSHDAAAANDAQQDSTAGDPTARALRLLERVGLTARLEHRPAELSGGEKQRVALARALINRPRLVLADEPTGNLDAASGAAVGELLAELARDQGGILVVATHSTALAQRFTLRYELRAGVLEALA
jgi:lipoprotein-releasing system ATP-binding protein